jgi:putative transposase
LKVAKIHKRVSDIRLDAIHKMTTELTKTKSVLGIETLNVKGMISNRCLAKAVQDASFGEIVRQLEYKGKWYGCRIVKADRWYPSSKTCSCCGHVNHFLKLKDREWTCPKCNTVHDRDENSSKNLRKVAVGSTRDFKRLRDCDGCPDQNDLPNKKFGETRALVRAEIPDRTSGIEVRNETVVCD